MNYVEHLNLFGLEAKEIPCIKGSGAPTAATAGAVGLFYMDTDTGELYKCTAAADGVYTWGNIADEVVQPDWNQNDSTAKDFIKNRPFYDSGDEVTVFVEGQVVTIAENESEYSAIVPGDFVPVEGETYLVYFNGAEYTCTAYGLYLSNGHLDGIALGNIDINAEANVGSVYENKGNGEPFAVEYTGGVLVLFVAEPGDHTIGIESVVKIVFAERYRNALNIQPDWNQENKTAPDYIKNKPFDTLPEQVQADWNQTDESAPSYIKNKPSVTGSEQVQADWNQTDSTALDYIKNRPFYYDVSFGDVVLEEQPVSVNTDYGELVGNVSGDFTIEAGKTYTVTFDDVRYTCVAYNPIVKGGTTQREAHVVLGNLDISSDAGMIGENEGNGEPFAIVYYSSASGSVLFTETAGEYLVSITDDCVVLPEQTVVAVYEEMEETNVASLSVDLSFEVGASYRVIVNGVAYDLVAENESAGGVRLGTGNDPVCIYSYVDLSEILFCFKEAGEYTVQILKISGRAIVVEDEYVDAIKAALPTVELTATLEDGTTQTYKLYGEAVTE